MTAVKLTAMGSSVGIVLPKEILERMRVSQGDSLYIKETPTGLELSAIDSDCAMQLSVADEVMKSNRDVLKRLAE